MQRDARAGSSFNWYDPATGARRSTSPTDGPRVDASHHYDVLDTEPRIASYVGIAEGQLPSQHYFRIDRTFPPTCDFSFQETQRSGVTRSYLGVSVVRGPPRLPQDADRPDLGAGACSRP